MNQKGFTLFELIITLSICSILALICSTSSQLFIRTNEQQVIIDDIRTILQLARTEALHSSLPIIVTPRNDDPDWSGGLSLSRYDKNTKLYLQFYEHKWFHPHWLLEWTGVKKGNQIYFSGNTLDAISNGHFILSNRVTKQSVLLVVNRLGRLKLEKGCHPG